VWGDRLRYDAACTNNCAVADRHSREDNDVAANPDVSADCHSCAFVTLKANGNVKIKKPMVTSDDVRISADQSVVANYKRFPNSQVCVTPDIHMPAQSQPRLASLLLSAPKSTISFDHCSVTQFDPVLNVRMPAQFQRAADYRAAASHVSQPLSA
jgi:hypothetical protein